MIDENRLIFAKITMNVPEVIRYWLESAEDDWPVAKRLVIGGDYHYALFIGHLYVEKLMKALVVQVTGDHAPRTHNLLILADRAGLSLSDDRREQLIRITAYNLETRYPEERSALRLRYTKSFTDREIDAIQEVAVWLKSHIRAEL